MGKVKRQPEVLGYSAAGGYPRKDLEGPRGATDEETGRNLAALLTGPAVAAYRVIRAAEVSSGIGDMLDVPTLVEHLRADAKAVQEGSLAQAEAMLANQAVGLQSLFARLAERAMGCGTVPGFEANMRYALRAQSQCRATLETLALIKQGPAVYARQANIAHGPQQVNNGGVLAEVRPGARAGGESLNQQHQSSEGHAQARAGGRIESMHPELLRTGDGERLDTGTAGTASGSNPALEAVGAVNRAKDGGR